MTVRSGLVASLSRDPKRDPRTLGPMGVIGPVPRQVPEGSDDPPEDEAGELDERGSKARLHDVSIVPQRVVSPTGAAGAFPERFRLPQRCEAAAIASHSTAR
jgi:hypothetical protein